MIFYQAPSIVISQNTLIRKLSEKILVNSPIREGGSLTERQKLIKPARLKSKSYSLNETDMKKLIVKSENFSPKKEKKQLVTLKKYKKV